MLKYVPFEEKLTDEYIGKYITYGIELFFEGKLIDRISDVDTDREGVETLCRLCNDLKLSPIHFHEVVEDYLNK